MTRHQWSLAMGGALAALLVAIVLPASAEIVLFDGFDDADRDNDGLSDDGNAAVVAANDGIGWYGINGLTGDLAKQKPFLTVSDDSGGIDSGNALSIESVGSNGEFIGAFDQTYQLGPAVGSRVSMSFDVRFTDLLLPTNAEFRFGLYGDTDNQFGSSGTNSDGSPTVWGASDGNFDAESPGAVGDLGIYTRVQFGVSPSLDGSGTRIADEANANSILGGAGDSDLINLAGDDLFGVINDGETNSFSLSVERVAPGASGETVMVTLEMTDSDGVVTTLSGLDGDSSATDTIATGDAFRYFVGSVTADADYLLDNFQLEVEGPSVLSGDFNTDGVVDAADYTVWRDNLGAADESSLNGAGNGMSGVDTGDYVLWRTNYGSGQPVVGATTAPEPCGAMLIALALAGGLARGSRIARR